MNPGFASASAALDAPASPSAGAEAIDERRVRGALSTVIDPEIGLDIVTLGLVFQVECFENAVRVTYTLTTPGCPMEGVITEGIREAVSAVPGVEHVLTNLVWEPHWHPGMIREGAW